VDGSDGLSVRALADAEEKIRGVVGSVERDWRARVGRSLRVLAEVAGIQDKYVDSSYLPLRLLFHFSFFFGLLLVILGFLGNGMNGCRIAEAAAEMERLREGCGSLASAFSQLLHGNYFLLHSSRPLFSLSHQSSLFICILKAFSHPILCKCI
jgi:hypothetical protein